jgi:hypothetical protein
MRTTLFGGSLINLALAECLYKNKKDFSWYTLGEKVGGHFSGVKIGGNFVDLGMVLLEFGTHDMKEFRMSRDPITSKALAKFFDAYQTVPASVKVKYESSLHPDFIISDDCKLIWERSFSSNPGVECPSEKWRIDYFESMTYDEYCMKAYPEFYSTLLEKFASKISYGGHKKMSCRYHRSAWLPLFYPDTVSGQNKDVKVYPFRKFLNRSVADVINEKFAFIKTKVETIFEEEIKDVDCLIYKTEAGKKFISCDLKKLDVECADRLDKFTYQTKINIAIFSANDHTVPDYDCVNDIDDSEIYRVFFQCSAKGTLYIVVEGLGTFANDVAWHGRARSYLEKNFNFGGLSLEFFRSFINGVRLPLPGSEYIIHDIKRKIDTKFASINFFNYGIQDGFQALSINRQLAHAFCEWWRRV